MTKIDTIKTIQAIQAPSEIPTHIVGSIHESTEISTHTVGAIQESPEIPTHIVGASHESPENNIPCQQMQKITTTQLKYYSSVVIFRKIIYLMIGINNEK